MTLTLKIKRLTDTAKLPTYAHFEARIKASNAQKIALSERAFKQGSSKLTRMKQPDGDGVEQLS